ncbi:hypothetical protein [Longirhabdus pacifica]|uniref:hypothetical protein n=1 Tax=Longirhabdus pacifica TaxID=2305227 RepID=UPI001008FFF3|nr:hypothetical protein [Longirhabdus pacifica]
MKKMFNVLLIFCFALTTASTAFGETNSDDEVIVIKSWEEKIKKLYSDEDIYVVTKTIYQVDNPEAFIKDDIEKDGQNAEDPNNHSNLHVDVHEDLFSVIGHTESPYGDGVEGFTFLNGSIDKECTDSCNMKIDVDLYTFDDDDEKLTNNSDLTFKVYNKLSENTVLVTEYDQVISEDLHHFKFEETNVTALSIILTAEYKYEYDGEPREFDYAVQFVY